MSKNVLQERQPVDFASTGNGAYWEKKKHTHQMFYKKFKIRNKLGPRTLHLRVHVSSQALFAHGREQTDCHTSVV